MSSTIVVRKITGADIHLDVDLNKTVSELKELIAASGKGKSIRVPGLSFKGHELRDNRPLTHYDITSKAVVQIVPPSTTEKVTLAFEKENGERFNLSVKSDIKISKLKEEIQAEERIDAKQLKLVRAQEDSDGDEVITLETLEDDAMLSSLSIQDEVIAVYSVIRDSPPPSSTGPSEFGVLLSVDERLEKNQKNLLGVAVKATQTLAEFKTQVLEKHGIVLSDYTLILIGRELKDDRKTLEALGLISGCTVHAVANLQFSVATLGGDEYPMVAGPMTRISAVRKMIQDVDTEGLPWSELKLTLDGVGNLRETQTLWDFDVLSGTTFTLQQRSVLTIKVRHSGQAEYFMELTLDEDDTFETVAMRISEVLGKPTLKNSRTGKSEFRMYMSYHNKTLDLEHTLKQEKFEGGETLDVVCLSDIPELAPDYSGPSTGSQ